MKSLILGTLGFALVFAGPMVKRQATEPDMYSLPDGAELIVGSIKHTFNCDGRQFGYYADQENNCRIFHVCAPVQLSETETEIYRYSFFCGNQTVFDQENLVCAFEEDAIDCTEAHNFYNVNDLFGKVENPPAGLREGAPAPAAAPPASAPAPAAAPPASAPAPAAPAPAAPTPDEDPVTPGVI